MNILKENFRKRKRLASFLAFLFLLVALPLSAYVVIWGQDFDSRSEAAIFNALVSDMEMKILENPEHVPGMIRLEFPDDVSSEEIEEIIGRARSVPEELMDTAFERVEYIYVEEEKMAEEMARYERYHPTEYVDLNYVFETFWSNDGEERVVPNDWNSSRHWYFDNVKLPEVWNLQGCIDGNEKCGGSEDVVVAVLDSGMAFNAPEVQGMNLWSGSGYNPSNHRDSEGHGTFVAGVIASTTNNNSSSVGIAHNVTIMPLKTNLTSNSVEGMINYAGKNRVDVLNMSFGSERCLSGRPFGSAFDYAYGRGTVLVAASGNGGTGCLSYPANDPKVIAVGAVNPNNSRSKYSQYGNNLDFVAPVGDSSRSSGNAVWQQTCSPCTGSVSYKDVYHHGTSFSSPQVAGAAGLIRSLDPSLSPSQVKQVLIRTVDDIGSSGKNPQTGYGLLNVLNIYEYFGVSSGPSLEFSISSEEVKYGEEVTLTWEAPDASVCQAGGGWRGNKKVAGSEKVSPKNNTTYNLTCMDEEGGEVVASVSVVVKELKLNLTISSEEIDLGEVVALGWEASGVSNCSARGSWSGTKPLSGTQEVRPRSDASFSLVCSQLDKQIEKQVSVKVVECAVSSDCRRAEPMEICHENTCLRGDVENTGSITVDDFEEFKKDFLNYKQNGWSESLRRSDLRGDFKVSMADYGIFVRSYMVFNKLMD